MLRRLKRTLVGLVTLGALALVAPLATAVTPEQLFEQLYGRQYRQVQSSTDTADDPALVFPKDVAMEMAERKLQSSR